VSPGLEVGDLNPPILRHRQQLLGLQFIGHIAPPSIIRERK
jgi:hypothetical protein